MHFDKPTYTVRKTRKKDIPKGVYTKDPASGEIIFNKEIELSDGVSVSWMCASRLVFFVTQGESEESPGTVYLGFCRFDQVNHLHLAVWIKFDVGRKSKHPL